MKFLFLLFLTSLLFLPIIGFIDGFKYKKNDSEYLDTARWIDGK